MAIKKVFATKNKFSQTQGFLPHQLTAARDEELDKVEGAARRIFMPRHKKGGSAYRLELDRLTPIFIQLYEPEP